MTTTMHSPGITDRRTAIGTEVSPSSADDARAGAAVAALLHRISGGLNNAAMAFELALAASNDSQRDASERVLHAGVGGVNQAARAVALLRELLSPGSGAARHDSLAHLADIIEMLRSRAALRTVALRVEGEPLPGDEGLTTPALALASLLEGLSALERAPPGTSLALSTSQTHSGPHLRPASAKDEGT